MSKISSESKQPMTSLGEASFLLRELASPAPIGDSKKAALQRASHRLSTYLKHHNLKPWSSNRITELFRGTDKRLTPTADEIDNLRGAISAKHGIRHDASISELRLQVAFLAARLAEIDPDFHVESIEAIGAKMPDQRA